MSDWRRLDLGLAGTPWAGCIPLVAELKDLDLGPHRPDGVAMHQAAQHFKCSRKIRIRLSLAGLAGPMEIHVGELRPGQFI
jgi:hypothetical protein